MDDSRCVIAGVDTHKEAHALCLLDGLGRKTYEGMFAADEGGYAALAAALGDPRHCAVVGIEGTTSYGAGLTRHLLGMGYNVVEVLHPKRDKRRPGSNKNDFKDAERAARDAIAENGTSIPKSQDGWAEAARSLDASREGVVRNATASMNMVKSLLNTAPNGIRAKFSGMTDKALMKSLSRRRAPENPIERALYAALRVQALTWLRASKDAAELEHAIEELVSANAPALLDIFGCRALTAAKLAIAAGDNPERMKSESSFASLCGACPVEASSGKIVRHRLNRGGNRQANRALTTIARTRMCYDARTKEYATKKAAQGKSYKETLRCLKRYIAREVYHALTNPRKADERKAASLKELRLGLGLTQADMADAMAASRSLVSLAERGKGSLALDRRYRLALERFIGRNGQETS